MSHAAGCAFAGKGTLCTLYTARATLQHLPASSLEADCSSLHQGVDHVHHCIVGSAVPTSPSVMDAGEQQQGLEEAQRLMGSADPATQGVARQHCLVCAAAAQGQQPVVVVELAGNRFLRK